MNLDSGSGEITDGIVGVSTSGINNLGGSQPKRSIMLMAGLRKNDQKTPQVLEEPWLGAEAKKPPSMSEEFKAQASPTATTCRYVILIPVSMESGLCIWNSTGAS